MTARRTKVRKVRKISEADALLALQVQHGYVLAYMPRKCDDTMMTMSRNVKTKETRLEPAICIQLIVPTTSELAKQWKPRTSRKKT
jgi:hypothetical protein